MRDAKGMQNDLAKERQRKIEQRTNKGQTTFLGGVDVCRERATNKRRTKQNPIFGVVASGAGNLQTNKERTKSEQREIHNSEWYKELFFIYVKTIRNEAGKSTILGCS